MLKKTIRIITLLSFTLTLFTLQVAAAADKPEEIEWTDLVPENYNPEKLVQEYQKKFDIDNLPDNDPKVTELLRKLAELQKTAPVNAQLNGKTVKLPGFVLPVESDGQQTTEFLLVPYYGACIHVPPPPANQTVYVTMQDKKGATIRKLFDTVWVTGILQTEKLSTDLADAGYTLKALKVEPYQ